MPSNTGTRIFDLRTDIFDPLKEKAEALKEQADNETAQGKPLRKAYNSLCDVLKSLKEKLSIEGGMDDDGADFSKFGEQDLI